MSLVWIILSLVAFSLSQCTNTYYNTDGSCNNVANPTFGAANYVYRVGVEGTEPGDVPYPSPPTEAYTLYSDRPNERVVSNAIIATHTVTPDRRDLNLIATLFGQLVTHDLTKNARPADFRSLVNITEPNDPFLFLADGTPKTGIPVPTISIRRSGGRLIDGKFRAHNEVTGWLDASFIYGSSATELAAVRGPSPANGRLWLKPYVIDYSRVLNQSAGSASYTEPEMLPVNAETGLPADIGALPNNPAQTFSAGDSRNSENMIILSLQTIWAREHNRQAAAIKAKNPSWTDAQIFQKARVITTALYQHVVYDEYLPTVWGKKNFNTHVGRYRGYQSNIDGSTGNSFAAAAMRVGHSTVKEDITVYNGCGVVNETLCFNGVLLAAGQALSGPFAANPGEILALCQGIDTLIQSAVFNKAEEGDQLIQDTLRNILISSPFATGVDVSVANIRRGRINAVPNFHALRQKYHPLSQRQIYGTPGCPASAQNAPGPDPLPCFKRWIESSSTAAKMRQLYGKVTKVDAYVGILVEKKCERDSLFGGTGTGIVLDQFKVTRNGDRFYYENLPESVLSRYEKREIERTSFTEILDRNTNLVTIDKNAFVAPRRPNSRECRHGGHWPY